MKELNKRDGFTLIEILIVIVILSIALTFSILVFGDFGKSRQAQMTAEKMQHMLVFLREQAILESSDLQVMFNPRGFRSQFLTAHLREQQRSLPRFTTGAFPTDIVVHFNNAQSAISELTIYFHASGAINPFKMSFGTRAHPDIVDLIGYPNGKIELSKPHGT